MSAKRPEPTSPEHDKLRAAKDRDATQALGEFLHEFLPSKGIHLAQYHKHGDSCLNKWGRIACDTSQNVLWAFYGSLDDLLYEFFGVDRDKLMAEKDALLAHIRGER
jgi:hypothetical protein